MTTIDSPSARAPVQPELVSRAVHSRFKVVREYCGENGEMEFIIDSSQPETKRAFLDLSADLRATGDMPILRKGEEGFILKTFPRPKIQQSKTRKPLILLVATIVAVFVDGLLRPSLFGVGASDIEQAIVIALVYAAALVGIIAIHESGHKIASWLHGMNSSWPYFIPGIPGVIPTLGAVINAREPPPNRDSLFDLGISGPIAGLIATVVVSIFAVASAQTFAPVSGQSYAPVDFWTSFLASFLVRLPAQNYVIGGTMFSLLYFAYTWGFLLTFVNLLPAWQLDGGHIANAVISPKTHRYLTFASAGVMFLTGFWLMALLILFLSNRYPALTPLDNVSSLSRNRKIFFGLVWILTAAIFVLVIYNNAFFWQNSLLSYL